MFRRGWERIVARRVAVSWGDGEDNDGDRVGDVMGVIIGSMGECGYGVVL